MVKHVSAAIIVNGDKILIAQRGPKYKLEFKWEFPGGGIEDGETPEECIVREIFEELNIKIRVDKFFDQSFYEYPHAQILLLAYIATWVSGEITLNDEHIGYRWVTVEELADYDFSPADIPLVQKLRDEPNLLIST